MAIGSRFQLTYVQTLNDVRFSNVLNYEQTNVDGSNDPRLDLAQGFRDTIEPLYEDILSNQWSSRCIQIRNLQVPGQDYFRLLTSGVGDLNVESLPSEICGQVRLYTATGGVGFTGRIFLSGIPVNREEDNCLDDAYLALALPLLNAMDEPIASGGVNFKPILWKSGGVALDIVLARLKTPLTTQRSRKQPFIC